MSKALHVPLALCRRLLGRSRGWFYYRPRRRPRGMPRPARRADLAAAVRQIVAECPPSYGYRRVHALLRRRGVRCNAKTVHKWLQANKLLASSRCLKPRRRERLHLGKVTVPASNRRSWPATSPPLVCENKERLRTVLAWRLSARVLAEDICELVREALHARFGAERQRASGLEFLTDNGPEFASGVLRDLLARLGLVACRTPRRSPQSNGAVEAFFSSLKRDYVSALRADRPGAGRLALAAGWVEHHNALAPHSALAMRSPTEAYTLFLQTQNSHPNSPTNPPP